MSSEVTYITRTAFDEATIRRFTAGDCALLASTISALTGWELALFTADEGAYTGHVVAIHPEGGYVDISGHWTYESGQFGEGFGTAETPQTTNISELETEGWEIVPGEDCLDPENWQYRDSYVAAMPAAQEVLRQIAI